MARIKANDNEENQFPESNRPPATTVDGRERQMINLAVDVAERQLRNGTASAQVITHYLKLATVDKEIERENLRQQNKLLQAKIDSLASVANSEQLMKEAIEAFTNYRPTQESDDD